MKKSILVFLMSFLCIVVEAQKIDFMLPGEANKEYVFSVFNGLKQDTIAKGVVSMVGAGDILVPERYKSIPSMGVLEIKSSEPIYLILNNESFSFSLSEKKELVFRGSKENDLFYNRQDEVMGEENNSTYVQSYVKTMSAVAKMMNILNQQGKSSLFEKGSARIAVLNDVDVDKLYYGRFWFFVIDGLLRLSPGEEGFANDMIRLLDKTKTEKVYVSLVEDLITIMNQYGLDDAFDIIIPHVEQSNRIEYPQGNIYDAFAMAKVRKGLMAPLVEGLKNNTATENNYDYTLLIFHQPGCDNCQEQLNQLKINYTYFMDKRVRIVSISGDTNKASFQKEMSNFPWQDKLCDFKGFVGVNFRSYGIMGTPTLYLIDKNNIVLGRFSTILDVKTTL